MGVDLTKNLRFRRRAIPSSKLGEGICGEDKQYRPALIGSAVLIHVDGADVLVTAAHVLTDNAEVVLFVFGADGRGQSLAWSFNGGPAPQWAVGLGFRRCRGYAKPPAATPFIRSCGSRTAFAVPAAAGMPAPVMDVSAKRPKVSSALTAFECDQI